MAVNSQGADQPQTGGALRRAPFLFTIGCSDLFRRQSKRSCRESLPDVSLLTDLAVSIIRGGACLIQTAERSAPSFEFTSPLMTARWLNFSSTDLTGFLQRIESVSGFQNSANKEAALIWRAASKAAAQGRQGEGQPSQLGRQSSRRGPGYPTNAPVRTRFPEIWTL